MKASLMCRAGAALSLALLPPVAAADPADDFGWVLVAEGNVRGDLLAGLVVALALIPEAIAFSIIAGVDPKVGLYASSPSR
jgi:MFS superfamily sulfate permease-like transporter